MKNYGVHILLLAVLGAAVFMSNVDLRGQDQQAAVLLGEADIAAWQGNIFVLRGTKLTKLNSELQVVKSVEIPSSGSPVPPEPPRPPSPPEPPTPPELPKPPVSSSQTARQKLGIPSAPSAQAAAGQGGSALATDAGYVYVLQATNVHLFDHELNVVRSGIVN
jgi:hypothetical protein